MESIKKDSKNIFVPTKNQIGIRENLDSDTIYMYF